MRNIRLLLGVIALLLAISAAWAKHRSSVEFLNSGKVVPKNLPFSEAVKVGDTLYLSGQIGIRPGTLELVPGGLSEETRQAMTNIKTTLAAHGYTMGDLIKCTVMLSDITKWSEFNDVYRTFFTSHYPARSAIGADGLALGAQVEIDCIASTGAGEG